MIHIFYTLDESFKKKLAWFLLRGELSRKQRHSPSLTEIKKKKTTSGDETSKSGFCVRKMENIYIALTYQEQHR
jgi:hypothetical protein